MALGCLVIGQYCEPMLMKAGHLFAAIADHVPKCPRKLVRLYSPRDDLVISSNILSQICQPDHPTKSDPKSRVEREPREYNLVTTTISDCNFEHHFADTSPYIIVSKFIEELFLMRRKAVCASDEISNKLSESRTMDEAEKRFVQVTVTSKKVLGPEHPDTLTSKANLAST
ncbi:hypothetical protein V8E54_007478 [Elaphomyces granulatus]